MHQYARHDVILYSAYPGRRSYGNGLVGSIISSSKGRSGIIYVGYKICAKVPGIYLHTTWAKLGKYLGMKIYWH